MTRFYRNRRNSTMFAALLLLLLVVLAGQNTFTGFISTLFQARPFCSNMREAFERDKHQSLIARAASARAAPVRVDIRVGNYPTTQDGRLDIQITFTNLTVGTVPFVYSGGVPINNPVPDGFGLVVGSQALPPVNPTTAFIPESNVRMLVPLQSCVEIVSLTVQQLQTSGIQPGAILRAYYRNGNIGQVQVTAGAVFADHGMWTGVAELRPAAITAIQAVAQ